MEEYSSYSGGDKVIFRDKETLCWSLKGEGSLPSRARNRSGRAVGTGWRNNRLCPSSLVRKEEALGRCGRWFRAEAVVSMWPS